MSQPPGATWRLERATQDRLLDALTRLAGAGAHARESAMRFLGHAERASIRLDNAWMCVDGRGRVRAAVVAVPGVGRTAQILASQPLDEEEVVATGRLIDVACQALDPESASVAQALLDPIDPASPSPALRAYLAGGFKPLATLDYMDRAVPRSMQRVRWPQRPGEPREATEARNGAESVQILPWKRPDPAILRALEASYRETRDCPGLCGLRRTEDILEGHLATGRYEPDLWSILWVDGEPCGALLLSPAHGAGRRRGEIELVYLGLSPEVRGRGLGRRLLEHGLAQIAGRPEERVALAVDRSNTPAVRLYSAAGFRRCASRLAVIRAIAPAPTDDAQDGAAGVLSHR